MDANGIKEIARMQRKIDEHERFMGDLSIFLTHENHVSIKNNIELSDSIFRGVEKMKMEINSYEIFIYQLKNLLLKKKHGCVENHFHGIEKGDIDFIIGEIERLQNKEEQK